jgi:hypothetical protein
MLSRKDSHFKHHFSNCTAELYIEKSVLEKAGKAICRILKFWYRILLMEQDE